MINLATLYKKKPIIFLVSTLVVIGFGVYLFNINNKLFWDDTDWIVNNNYVHKISWDNVKFWLTHDVLAGVGLTSNYYRPFLFFTFALNYLISGIAPWSYHLFSNIFHLINGVLVFFLIYTIFNKKSLAFLTSLIFLIHPLQTEAVTYISGRGDVLAAFFMLSAMWFFVRDVNSSHRNIKLKLLISSLLVLGLLSRETAILFPVLALLLYFPLSRYVNESNNKKHGLFKSIKLGIIKTWPYFAVVISYGILRLTTLNFVNTLNFYNETNIYSQSILVRMFSFLPILAKYIGLLFVPVGLHMERDATIYTSFLYWPVWITALIIVAIVCQVFRFYRKEKLSGIKYTFSNSNFAVLFFGIAWFLIALSPASGITPINALIYEHWLYLPMVGFWLIISFYLLKLFNFIKNRKLNAVYLILITALVIYVGFFVNQSIKRNIIWGNESEFYRDILKYEPNSPRINNNLGNFYYDHNDPNQAESYYRKAIELDSAFAQPYYNLGTILQSKGDLAGAIKLYDKAIEIQPGFFYSYQNLAVIYARQGNFAKASQNIENLKQLIPNNPRVYFNSALIYIALNDKNKALQDVETGLKYVHSDSESGKLLEDLAKQLR